MIGSYVLVIFTSFLLVCIIVGISVIHFIVLVRYLRATTELKRIFRIARSPVLTSLSELASGLTQIKLYGYEKHLKKKWAECQELSVQAQLHELYAFAWVILWVYSTFGLLALSLGLNIVLKKNFR